MVIEEPESAALDHYLRAERYVLTTTRLAIVEVTRAVKVANGSAEVEREALRLLNSCLLVNVSDSLIRQAARMSSERIRSLNAIHLATAVHVEPDAALVYDRRLEEAMSAEGLTTVAPR